jgi:hypothetical protein
MSMLLIPALAFVRSMAEGERFELSRAVTHAYRFSKPAPSAAWVSLQRSAIHDYTTAITSTQAITIRFRTFIVPLAALFALRRDGGTGSCTSQQERVEYRLASG